VSTWADVARLALALPGATEVTNREGRRQWKVKDALFVWERPLRDSDLRAYATRGETPPDDPILGVRVADEGVKRALVAADPDVFFTIPHFDGYPAVLVRLDVVDVDELAELVEDAWLLRAPKRAVTAYLAARPATGDTGHT
jgi:hypothetical protein